MKKFLLVFVALFCTVLLVGCGSDYKKKMAGSYTMIEMKSGKETITAKQLKSLGVEATLEVKADGTAKLDLAGDKTELKFDKKYFTDKKSGKEKIKYTVKGKKLTMEDDDTSMVFEKK